MVGLSRLHLHVEREWPESTSAVLFVVAAAYYPGRTLLRIHTYPVMIIVHVSIHVKPESVNDFTTATLENARNSVAEPGVIRFDLVQQDDDPTRFVLVEIYRTPADPVSHKETAHYATWRDTVAPMMAEPRQGVKYHAVVPEPDKWEYPR